jgi:hypothetical protein
MLLVDAMEQAKARSLQAKKTVFIDLKDGDCSVVSKQSAISTHAIANGVEVPLPAFVEKKVKEPKVKSSSKPKKKAMEKVAKKKTAPKKAAKKTEKKKVTGKAKTVTVKQLIADIGKGKKAYTPGGTPHSLKYLKSLSDKDVTREVIYAE